MPAKSIPVTVSYRRNKDASYLVSNDSDEVAIASIGVRCRHRQAFQKLRLGKALDYYKPPTCSWANGARFSINLCCAEAGDCCSNNHACHMCN